MSDVLNNGTVPSPDGGGDGTALTSISHPQQLGFKCLWFWFRNTFWPYDISPESIETIEIEQIQKL